MSAVTRSMAKITKTLALDVKEGLEHEIEREAIGNVLRMICVAIGKGIKVAGNPAQKALIQFVTSATSGQTTKPKRLDSPLIYKKTILAVLEMPLQIWWIAF